MNRFARVTAALLIVSAFFIGTIYAGSNGKSWVDPDKGKTRAQVVADQKAMSDRFWARYPEWIKEQVAAGVDPSKLPAAPILASVVASAPTLTEASKRAVVVAQGKVTDLQFRSDGDTVASLAVSRSLKGTPEATIQVHFAGGLQPWPDWDHPSLSYLDAAPIPLPGTEVVLFLDAASSPANWYEPQMFTGVYEIGDDGTLEPLEGNPFAGSMTPLTVDALSAKVAEAVVGN